MISEKTTIRSHTIGECIYCGSKDDLTDEHIIAYGLGGFSKMLKASCKSCATITGKIEQHYMRSIHWPLRGRMNLPTRRKKEKPDTFAVLVKSSEGVDTMREVAASEYPIICMGIRVPPAKFLYPSNDTEIHIVVRQNEEEIREYLKKIAQKGDKIKIGRIIPDMVARMLAKIAHSYARAITFQTNDTFIPFLPDVILGKSQNIYDFVGAETGRLIPEKEPELHVLSAAIAHKNGKQYLVIRIRLFANIGMPAYEVVTGELKQPSPSPHSASPVRTGSSQIG